MCEKNNETILEDYCEEAFAEFVSDLQLSLEANNKDYKNLNKQRFKILDDYPNVREIIENGSCESLNSEEVKALMTYISLMDSCSIIVEKELFLKGMKEVCCLLKN